MSTLVSACHRCGAQNMTFDVLADVFTDSRFEYVRGSHQDVHYVEAFGQCRNCNRGTIFVLKTHQFDAKKSRLSDMKANINSVVDVSGFINLKDVDAKKAPEHLPKEVESAFNEGARCMAVGCYNAGGTMFRLCVDLTTVGLLPTIPGPPVAPAPSPPGPNYKQRRDLGLRLKWLFDNKLLPDTLHELAKCIQEDGNDSAHRGTLSKADSEDLLDFTEALLERMFTEPKRLELAQARREARRAP